MRIDTPEQFAQRRDWDTLSRPKGGRAICPIVNHLRRDALSLKDSLSRADAT